MVLTLFFPKTESANCFLISGKPGSLFAWHVEDRHLASLNYGHNGSPKLWWAAASKDYETIVGHLNRFVFFNFKINTTSYESFSIVKNFKISRLVFQISMYPDHYGECNMAHQHKTFFLNPEFFEKSETNFFTVCFSVFMLLIFMTNLDAQFTQNAGEFIVTFPGSFHQGW